METDTTPPHTHTHKTESGRQAQSPAQGPKEDKTYEQWTETPKGRRERRREEGSAPGEGKRQGEGAKTQRRGQRSRGEGQGTQMGQRP